MNEYGIESIWLQVEVGDPCLLPKKPAMRAERRRIKAVKGRKWARRRDALPRFRRV